MKTFSMLLMAAFTILSLSVLGQDSTKHNKMHKAKTGVAAYCCTMHTDVTSNKPGKCTKCGMDMNRTAKEQMKMETMKTYFCPMHPDSTSTKAGNCVQCGRVMSPSLNEKLKWK